MKPAHSIIAKLGGPSAVAGIVGIHRTRVSNWKRPREVGGTGGLIPQRHIPDLLAYARQHGIELTADDFFAAPSTPPASEPAEAQP